MDRLSQALAAGFNAPVVYIQLPNGILVAPTAVRAVRYFPLAVGTEGTNRWRSGEAMVGRDLVRRSPLVLPGS